MKRNQYFKTLTSTIVCVFSAMMVAKGLKVEVSNSSCGNLGGVVVSNTVTFVSAGHTAYVHDTLSDDGIHCTLDHQEANRDWNPNPGAALSQPIIEGPFTSYL